MNRYMALDVGDRTIGVAVSDPLFIMAEGYSTIFRESIEKDLESLKNIIVKENIIKVVVGLPKNMNNTSGPRVEASQAYGEKVAELFGLPVDYQDERLTTVAAERMLIEQADVSRSKRKKVIDKLAAQLILQNYLDRNY